MRAIGPKDMTAFDEDSAGLAAGPESHGPEAPFRTRHMPAPGGLYRPDKEHDSCGVGFVVNLNDSKSHKIVADGLQILLNLTHRGATGYDPKLGDGAGMLTQLPHRLFT